MVFASVELVRRIEHGGARALEQMVLGGGPSAAVREVAGGLALYRGEGSPLNKVAGLGFEPISAEELAQVEAWFAERAAPVQVELATHADPAITHLLVTHGYHFTGFENVLGMRLTDAREHTLHSESLTVRRAQDHERAAWIRVLTDGFSVLSAGEQAAEHDVFDRAALERVFADMANTPAVQRWIALQGERVVGAASLLVGDGLAQLSGAATHPDARRRGVQSALLAARLEAGRASGCELALITTQPGSKSQQNAQRAGFELLYSRAIWLRPHGGR